MDRRHPLLALLLAVQIGAGCSETASTIGPGDPAVGDPVAGAAAFAESCAPCHAARDGFDLAYFSFPDTAISRRASPHVDPETGQDIAAYIGTLPVTGVPRGTRPFQPGGTVLPGDIQFAVRLFGTDGWPADWTTADLLAVDPLDVALAVPLPRWSEETTNLDWMPDAPLEETLLEHRGGRPRTALEGYYRTRTWESLGLAVAALRTADRDPLNPEAPCRREPPDALDGPRCFETRRWTASLVAQHMLREGRSEPVHPLLHDAWWDVGNAARLALAGSGGIERGVENWASWMTLGWMFDPGRHASVYTGNGLLRVGLPRHATFTTLRSQVARPEAREAVVGAYLHAARHATSEERARLAGLRNAVLAGLE